MNALSTETSPYLLQHADNPVAWYPWSEQALQLAKTEDKPILLSIGYSACHWCHVMAHESFEDEATARLMNELFVNIKVDREERPDLDKIYQVAHHLLTSRNGGWPLTVFLTPTDHTPVFAGTYFPPTAHYGLPSFQEVLRGIARAYRERHGELREQQRSLRAALQRWTEIRPGNDALDDAPLNEARAELGRAYDARYGGFGHAPKFPHPPSLERLLRHYAASLARGQADPEALDMALTTLERMALGGLHDQLGGGFCRYSVDERWLIPHFEKMLYDNALLLALYSEAWQVSGRPVFAKAAIETGAWLLREMQSPDGGFYSSLDADSEGHEGRYYVWDRQAVQAALDAEDYALFARHFGLEQAANFEGQHHLYVAETIDSIAASLGEAVRDVEARIARARAALLAIREQRVRPGLDEKCLTAWNALAIKGLAIAGRVFERPDLLAAADRALGFIRSVMWRDGTLLATCKDGRAHLNAYLDDYVFLIDAVLALLQARWRNEDLAFAQALAEVVLARFEDPEQGGFFYTSHDHERLILRTRSGTDDALPAGAGIAAQVLLRLGSVLGEARYLDTAERALKVHAQAMASYPSAFHTLLHALEDRALGCETVILRGSGAALAAWHSRCHRYYAPRRLSLAIPDSTEALPAALAQRRPEGEIVAYRCQGLQCSAPIKTLGALEAALVLGEVRAPAKAPS